MDDTPTARLRALASPGGRLEALPTPLYLYDTPLLHATLRAASEAAGRLPGSHLHYAVKACANPRVLAVVAAAGLGADCVSGGEIQACLDAGFDPQGIVFAGVGKSDWEIDLALRAGIGCFNVESLPELEAIARLARAAGREARVCLRLNPEVGAHTHAHITTGTAENKFGIAMDDAPAAIARAQALEGVTYAGLHFHIGSQILDMGDFAALCRRVNELQERLEASGAPAARIINVGGGLGIDYLDPDARPVPDFDAYFSTYARGLLLRPGQETHFELGRSLVGQCGTLIARCLYVKQGAAKQFAILDAGFTELIRPALYGARHLIQNLTSQLPEETYDVVGPICESSDVFAKDYSMSRTRRGDLVALRSAGAYGESMASQYNCRRLPASFLSEDLK